MSASFRVSKPSARARRERRQAGLGHSASCQTRRSESSMLPQEKVVGGWMEVLLRACAAWGRTHAETPVGRRVDSSLRWLERRLHRAPFGAARRSIRHRYQSVRPLPNEGLVKRPAAHEPIRRQPLSSPVAAKRDAVVTARPEPVSRTVRIYSSPSRVIWVGRIDEICSLIERRIAEEQARSGS
ncbi:MAG: hypothetical protein ACRYGG_11975 [Janthinobacterium lividum]